MSWFDASMYPLAQMKMIEGMKRGDPAAFVFFRGAILLIILAVVLGKKMGGR